MNNKEKRLNVSLTFILHLNELILRLMVEEIDNVELKRMLKKSFKSMFKEAKKVDTEYRKFIRQCEKLDDPEEVFDTDVDYLYELIKATVNLDSGDKYIKAIACVQNIANSK